MKITAEKAINRLVFFKQYIVTVINKHTISLTTIFTTALLTITLSACQSGSPSFSVTKQYDWLYQLPEEDYIVSSTGYAPIDTQRGVDATTKMVKAIKASKLDAYRDLTEKVHGFKLSGNVSLQDYVLGDEKMKASVQGVIKGARIIKTYHLDGVYITELELNLRDLYRVRAFTNGQTRVVNTRYH